jgi:hypothetical protein
MRHLLLSVLIVSLVGILIIPNAFAVSVFATDEDKIQELNNLIALRADQWSTIASPVVAVDHYTGFDISLHTTDGVHPNRLGDKKMADTWTDALLSLKIDTDDTINILLLGDSITDGHYRFDLWRNLQSEEIDFDFIGMNHNFPDPNQFLVSNKGMAEAIDATDEELIQFDQDHDAIGGIRSDNLVERGTLQNFKIFHDSLSKPDLGLEDLPKERQPVCSKSFCKADGTCEFFDVPCTEEDYPKLRQGALLWLESYYSDVVLLHIGTNDLIQEKTPEHVVVQIDRMISILRTQNPNVTILVAQIIPFDYCARENFPSCVKISASAEAATETETSPETRGGGCLIATAAFGSEMAPQVQFLREIRDNTVLQTESGTSFMAGFNQFYYSFSPAIADYERENPVFKETVKIALTPLLTSLTLLQYANIDSESEMLGYGISAIMLNIGMYFVAPAVIMLKLVKKYRKINF